VSGLVRYRPSGAVLRIEAEHLAPATEEDAAAWSKLPGALEAAEDVRSLWRPQGPRSGLAKIFGRWPGEETDEEIERFLAELSRPPPAACSSSTPTFGAISFAATPSARRSTNVTVYVIGPSGRSYPLSRSGRS